MLIFTARDNVEGLAAPSVRYRSAVRIKRGVCEKATSQESTEARVPST